jgi:aryl carrier-like protein
MSAEPGFSRRQAESVLAAAWREILELPSVGHDENFFDLGGNSVRAIQLLATIRERLESSIEILDLFRYPTIRSLLDAFYPERNAAAASSSAAALRAERFRRGIEGMRQQRRQTYD